MSLPGRLILALLWLLAWALPAQAHDGLPLTIVMTEQNGERYTVRLVLPPSVTEGDRPLLSLSAPCRRSAGNAFVCPGGLSNVKAEFDWPRTTPSLPTLVRITWRDGQQGTALGAAGQSRIALPVREDRGAIFADYLWIGIDHILTGWDHLAFLACLAILAGSFRRIALVVTGFTLGHATSICASALGFAGLPATPVEAMIAFSVMVLAAEVIRNARSSLIWRFPFAISALFGVFHGFGFATALAEIGLPRTELPAALLAFNLGIELGQLALVLAGLAVFALMRRIWEPGIARVSTSLVWSAGCIAGYWFMQRLGAILAGA